MYAKCTPITFDDLVSECLHYNVNIRRGRRVVCIRHWTVSLLFPGHFLDPNEYLSHYEVKAKFPSFPMSGLTFCCIKDTDCNQMLSRLSLSIRYVNR